MTKYKIIHHSDYTNEEIASTWLGASEMNTIKRNILATLSLMKTDMSNADDCVNHCSRGLEHFTEEGAATRRQRRDTAIAAVLDEQDVLHENNDYNCQLIADSYSYHVRVSISSASSVGRTDAKAVTKMSSDEFSSIGSPTLLRFPSSVEVVLFAIKGTCNSKGELSISALPGSECPERQLMKLSGRAA